MSRFFDEKFEGTGYEEIWSESLGAGCTINEDAASSDVSSPTGWGTQCLKIITANATGNMVYVAGSDVAVTYTRIEAIFTDLSNLTSDDQYFIIAFGSNGILSNYTWRLLIYRASGVNYILFDPFYDGSGHPDVAAVAAEDTRYRFEVRWDTANNLYECKINGTSVRNGSLTTGSVQLGALVIGDNGTGGRGWTGYFDLIAIDDAAWVGSELITGSSCWGHSTDVTQDNTRPLTTNWTGTGSISGSGDSEKIELSSGQYMESEIVQISGTVRVRLNVYVQD